jgi:hypothetical protein
MKPLESLNEDEVFVFGSNEAGRHGAGAALDAQLRFGAQLGVGNGPTGRCYAIPTKDRNVRTLPLQSILFYVNQFRHHATRHASTRFIVTPIGCGLAGYSPRDIAPMFSEMPSNVILPAEFQVVLNQRLTGSG